MIEKQDDFVFGVGGVWGWREHLLYWDFGGWHNIDIGILSWDNIKKASRTARLFFHSCGIAPSISFDYRILEPHTGSFGLYQITNLTQSCYSLEITVNIISLKINPQYCWPYPLIRHLMSQSYCLYSQCRFSLAGALWKRIPAIHSSTSEVNQALCTLWLSKIWWADVAFWDICSIHKWFMSTTYAMVCAWSDGSSPTLHFIFYLKHFHIFTGLVTSNLRTIYIW